MLDHKIEGSGSFSSCCARELYGCFCKEATVDIGNGVQRYLSIKVRNSLQDQGCVSGTCMSVIE